MYLRISNESVVLKSDIIGIFDMDNTTVSRQGRNFLPDAEKKGMIIYTTEDLPKSYVVTMHDGKTKIYMSSLSAKVLSNRAKSSTMLI